MNDATPILQARGLVKRYGHVVALGGADFELYPGEILAVIGDNGAGKSTLIKCLSGATVPDEGEIQLDGKRVQMRNPLEAHAMEIETVYQTLAISPSLNIATNLFLEREPRAPGLTDKLFRKLDKRKMREEARRHMGELGILTIQNIGQQVESLSATRRVATWANSGSSRSRTSASRSSRFPAASGRASRWRGPPRSAAAS